MTTSNRTSTALLAAWFVLIAALIGSIVFFALRGQAPQRETEPTVVPVPARPKPAEQPKSQPRTSRHAPGVPPVPPKDPELTGTVKGPDGKPVAGAHVALFAQSATKPGAASPPDMQQIQLLNQIIYIAPDEWDLPRPLETWTGGADGGDAAEGAELAGADSKDDGTFVLTLKAHHGIGPFRLAASKDIVGSASIAEVRADSPPLDIVLGPASIVTGRVITEVDSIPVEGARVVFNSGARRISARTNAEGHFSLDGVTPGRYEVRVDAKGRTPLFDPNYMVATNLTVPQTLVLPRGTTLRIKAVIDTEAGATASGSEGQPVANAKIAAYCEDTLIYVLGTTNAQGLVEFAGLPAGHYSVNGLAPGVTSIGEEQVVIDRNQLVEDQTISFEPAVETAVDVVDEEGRPVAGVDFYTVNADGKYDALRSIKAGVTDSDGKFKYAFEFDGPRCALFGFKPGFALVHAYPDDNTSGEPLHLVAKKAVTVHGTVKSTEGHAIPNSVVTIDISPDDAMSDDMQLEVRTDRDGRYQFPYLPRSAGAITIGATAPDGVSQEDQDLELVSGQTDYTVDLLMEFDELVTPQPQKTPAPRVPPPAPGGGKNGMK